MERMSGGERGGALMEEIRAKLSQNINGKFIILMNLPSIPLEASFLKL